MAAGVSDGSAGSAAALATGANGTVRSARAIGPDCSGIGTDFSSCQRDAASANAAVDLRSRAVAAPL